MHRHGYGAMYAGDGQVAHERLEQAMPVLRRSLLVRLVSIRAHTSFGRGRAAIAAIESRPRDRAALVVHAHRMVALLQREADPWIGILAALVTAAAENADGHRDAAIRALERAVARCEATDTLIFRAPALHRLGELRGGPEGEALMREGADVLDAWGIRNRTRWYVLAGDLVGGAGTSSSCQS